MINCVWIAVLKFLMWNWKNKYVYSMVTSQKNCKQEFDDLIICHVFISFTANFKFDLISMSSFVFLLNLFFHYL